jgi:hypothetical protein
VFLYLFELVLVLDLMNKQWLLRQHLKKEKLEILPNMMTFFYFLFLIILYIFVSESIGFSI